MAEQEVTASLRLRAMLAALLASQYYTFVTWYHRDGFVAPAPGSMSQALPAWPLANSGSLLWLDRFWLGAYGYHLEMLALAGILWLFATQRARVPLLILAFLWCNEVYFYLNDWRVFSNEHHVSLYLTLVFLVARPRLQFMRLAIASVFILLALGQANPSWLSGQLWTSIPGGLPGLPDDPAVIRVASVLTVCIEAVGPWLWLSRSPRVRLATTAVLGALQLYWSTMWGPGLAFVLLPTLVLAWGPGEEEAAAAPTRVGWGLVAAALVGGLWPHLLPGDVRLTGQGAWAGLNFCDANRHVRADIDMVCQDVPYHIHIECPAYGPLLSTRSTCTIDGEGVVFNPRVATVEATPRALGDPYFYYALARQLYRIDRPDHLAMRAEVQLDGQPTWQTIVDVPDFSTVTYNPFGVNPWINP